MTSSESELSENGEIVPEAIKEKAKTVTLNLLPSKSKKLYISAYHGFKKWQKENKSNSFCEEVILEYFADLSKKYLPSSLWATYSMLKCSINAYDHVDIGCYKKLRAFLKKKSLGYRSKKSLAFSRNNILKFLNEAPDDVYLCEKVALIFGIAGALKREEFVNITVGDVQILEENALLVKISNTKNYVPRLFTIANGLFDFCWRYIQARPEACSIDRFFLRYSQGECIQQAVGINKFGSMPKDIAEYLNLPDAKYFTGHSFRRTSATLLVDAGADLTMLKRHEGWKSAAEMLNADANPGAVGQTDPLASTSGVNNTFISKENQVTTSATATTSILKNYQNSQISIPPATTNQEASVVKTEHCSISGDSNHGSSEGACEVQPQQETKLPCFYHPDIGLYIKCSTNQDAPLQNCIFNNCNVQITGSNNTFILNNCKVENEAVQTENCGKP